ncbi:MAG: hypothetical protein KDD52_03300, partial [Bdellovibrionales bacterium]|nr:hypothetical protein [Bdellovibrionales bacterium]
LHLKVYMIIQNHIRWFTIFLIPLLFVACLKVDDFDEKRSFEGFVGSALIQFGVEGVGADTYVPQTIFITGNDKGDRLILSGVIDTRPISLKEHFPKDVLEEVNRELEKKGIKANDPLSFSGFGGYPKNKNLIIIDKILGPSDGFTKLGFEVEGYFLKDGSRVISELSIYQTIGSMKKSFPETLLDVFVATDSGLAISEEPEERNTTKYPVILYKLLDGQNLTVGG